MQETTKNKGISSPTVIGAGAAWALVYLACLGIVKETSVPRPLGVALALAPIAPFVAFLWALGRAARGTDELHRRVQLEALAFAFPAMMVLLMTLGLLELVVPLNPEDFSLRHIWAYMPALYGAGLGLAWRRYR